MLYLDVEGEFFDNDKQEFVYLKPQRIAMEHSLISISKWESKYHVPFLETKLTDEQLIYYMQCMTITKDVNPLFFANLSNENYSKINDYINDPMTATSFNDVGSKSRNREIITSEIIYYWMVEYNIPLECEKWHINRLLTLIRVVNIKNTPAKKMSKSEVIAQQKRLNKQRRRKYNSKG